MTRRYFGTDGVRGPFGGPVINPDFAARLAYAAARWLPLCGAVLVGRDTRHSGSALEAGVMRGLRAAGATPIALGVVPTPAIARAVRTGGAVLGVVITASHNPAEDNGIKFFGASGVKLTDEQEFLIEQLLPESLAPGAGLDGMPATWPANAAADYIEACAGLLPPRALAGWRVVLDTAHGATCATTPKVLRALGAELVGIGDAPDGRNINAGVGSEHPAQLAARVQAEGARLGIAHDGDGDRCVLCDEQGGVLDGDEILTILATHALAGGRLANNLVVATQQSNLGLDAVVAASGGHVLRTQIGDRYVVERMLAQGAQLGGESSGHIICADVSSTGDGLIAALKVIMVMRETDLPLSVLRRRLVKFPQLTAALKVKEKTPLALLPGLGAVICALETEMGDQGRVLVRYSGTEPKLRLLVEGPTDAVVRGAMARLDAAVRAELDVLA